MISCNGFGQQMLLSPYSNEVQGAITCFYEDEPQNGPNHCSQRRWNTHSDNFEFVTLSILDTITCKNDLSQYSTKISQTLHTKLGPFIASRFQEQKLTVMLVSCVVVKDPFEPFNLSKIWIKPVKIGQRCACKVIERAIT